MRALMVDVLLALAVLSAWLACAGFVRLRSALDRLHCAVFVNVVTGLSVVLAAAIQGAGGGRVWKVALLFVITLATGAAVGHAAGRALYLRGGKPR